MKTVCINVYQFSELSDKAKKVALSEYVDINVSDNWWESTYEDAANIGLKITGFDFDRGRNTDGEFTVSAVEVAANIIRDHGQNCGTYKAAEQFLKEHNPVFSKYMETEEGEKELLDIEEDFLETLLFQYANILQKQYEYLTSDKAIIETIEANEYEFTADGKTFKNPS